MDASTKIRREENVVECAFPRSFDLKRDLSAAKRGGKERSA
jgi:hypothetical protein